MNSELRLGARQKMRSTTMMRYIPQYPICKWER
jgi:hypothetical protein